MAHYRREIDGLRAVAVVPVMLFHAGFGAFAGGFVGVDVFFVISGYLITSIILVERQAGTFTLAGFYERRARRILPALLLVMLACVPVAWLWLMPPDMKSFSESLVAAGLMGPNVLFWLKTGYFSDSAELTPLLHTWSLGVEEQYYVVFPALLLALLKLGQRWVLLAAGLAALASLGLAQWASTHHPAAAFYLLPTRAWELLVGVMLALLATGREPSGARHEIGAITGLALIAIAVLAFDRQTAFPGAYALVPVLGAALVIRCAGPETIAGRVLGGEALVALGLISYGAYLWHQPLLAFARYRSATEPRAALLAGLCLAAFALAYVSWRLLEVPARDRKRWRAAIVLPLCALGTVMVVAFGVTGYLTKGFAQREPAQDAALRSLRSQYLGAIFGTGCDSKNDELPGCTGGAPGAPVSVALWGDSHAAMFVPEVDRALRSANRRFVRHTKLGCLAAFGLKSVDDNGCEKWSRAAFKDILSRDVSTIIVASRWQLFAEGRGFDNGEGGVEVQRTEVAALEDSFAGDTAILKRNVLRQYTATLRELVGTGRRIILIYPVPEAGWDVPNYLARRAWFDGKAPADLSTSFAAYRERNRDSERALDAVGEHPNLIRIRPAAFLCNLREPGRCMVHQDGVPLYFDDDHLAAPGARRIVAEVMRLLE